MPRKPGGEAVGEEDVLLAKRCRGVGADAEALVEADAGGAHGAQAHGDLVARGAGGVQPRQPAAGQGALARPAVGVERTADEEVEARVLGEEAADAGLGARRVADVVVGEKQDLASRPVERGVAAAREPGGAEPHDGHVGPGRRAGRAPGRAAGRRPAPAPAPAHRRPARTARRGDRARARARRGSRRRRSGSAAPPPRPGGSGRQPSESREVPPVALLERRGGRRAAAGRSGWRRSGGRARRAC